MQDTYRELIIAGTHHRIASYVYCSPGSVNQLPGGSEPGEIETVSLPPLSY